MKYGLYAVWFILATFLIYPSPAFSADKGNESAKETEWELYSEKGDYVGMLRKEDDRFVFHDKDEITLKEKKKNVWSMLNQQNESVGTLEKYKDSSFKVYDKNETYIGIILSSGDLRPAGVDIKTIKTDSKTIKKHDRANITPQAVSLYLHCLDVIDKIK